MLDPTIDVMGDLGRTPVKGGGLTKAVNHFARLAAQRYETILQLDAKVIELEGRITYLEKLAFLNPDGSVKHGSAR